MWMKPTNDEKLVSFKYMKFSELLVIFVEAEARSYFLEVTGITLKILVQ